MTFWKKLTSGLSKTSKSLSDGISSIFTHKKLDNEILDNFEELLIKTDMGIEIAAKLRKDLEKQKMHREISEQEIKNWLEKEIAKILIPVTSAIEINSYPEIILVVGVNGVGKTTAIAKLSHLLNFQANKKILWAACDTFRSAAVEQLQIWGGRLNIDVLTTKHNGDAAGLAYDATKKATVENYDVLFIDTAGRLQNKQYLMDELLKINKVIKKNNPSAPHKVILVLDATTGQNAIEQLKVFKNMIGVTHIVVNKLDGTAKGGIIVAIADKFKIPVIAVGVGESIEDLNSFSAEEFAKALIN